MAGGISRGLEDFRMALSNLRAQKTRTFLTALGIVFGVGSVIGMLAIGEGAKQESLRFIEQLGVRNILVDSRPPSSEQELTQRRRVSPGLTHRDVRIIKANIEQVEMISPRRSLHPSQVLPKPAQQLPELFGVTSQYQQIHNLRAVEGSFFTEKHDQESAPVCILGEAAKVNLLGYDRAVGKSIKINDTWLQVIGVIAARVAAPGNEPAGAADINNIIYVPLNTFQYRFWDVSAYMKDQLDGVDIRLKPDVDSEQIAKVVTGILNGSHHDTPDFNVTIPAALLAQQKKQQELFTYVMVAIAAISLLVGGIGIMNIVLATVMERTKEIGIRRAIGARQTDIVRQFLIESVTISVGGGALGVAFGFFLSWLIANVAEWATIVSTMSIVVAFGVSAVVGILFGIYPAVKASQIDPIEALRYE
jgi:putative ABC transport system permease protein